MSSCDFRTRFYIIYPDRFDLESRTNWYLDRGDPRYADLGLFAPGTYALLLEGRVPWLTVHCRQSGSLVNSWKNPSYKGKMIYPSRGGSCQGWRNEETAAVFQAFTATNESRQRMADEARSGGPEGLEAHVRRHCPSRGPWEHGVGLAEALVTRALDRVDWHEIHADLVFPGRKPQRATDGHYWRLPTPPWAESA